MMRPVLHLLFAGLCCKALDQVTAESQPQPAPPEKLKVEQFQGNHLNISWQAPANSPVPIDYYFVEYRTVGGWVPLVQERSHTWFVWRTASFGAIYNFRVTSVHSLRSESSDVVSIRTKYVDYDIEKDYDGKHHHQLRSNDDNNEQLLETAFESCNRKIMRCQRYVIPFYSYSFEITRKNLRGNGIKNMCTIVSDALECVYKAVGNGPCDLPGVDLSNVKAELLHRIQMHFFLCETNSEVTHRNLDCLLEDRTSNNARDCFKTIYRLNLNESFCDPVSYTACTDLIQEADPDLCQSKLTPFIVDTVNIHKTLFKACEDTGDQGSRKLWRRILK